MRLSERKHISAYTERSDEWSGKSGGWLHLPLNPFRMKKLTENYVVSNAKIKTALGIDRMPIRAKEGLMYTIRSFSQK